MVVVVVVVGALVVVVVVGALVVVVVGALVVVVVGGLVVVVAVVVSGVVFTKCFLLAHGFIGVGVLVVNGLGEVFFFLRKWIFFRLVFFGGVIGAVVVEAGCVGSNGLNWEKKLLLLNGSKSSGNLGES